MPLPSVRTPSSVPPRRRRPATARVVVPCLLLALSLFAAQPAAPALASSGEAPRSTEFDGQIFRLLHLPDRNGARADSGRPSQRQANLTGLFVAMASGDLERVRRCTPPREFLNAVDRSSGATPLTWAAQLGDVRMVAWLVNRGASVSALDGLGATPLVCAARYGHEETVRALLDYGAEPDQTTDLGLTPLLAACGPQGNLTTVRLLLARGAVADAPRASGWTALATAVKAGHEDIVVELLRAGARPGGDPSAAYSPLHWAVTENSLDLARLLLNHGADANAVGQRGIRPLDWCRSDGMRALLVHAGARPGGD